MASAKCKHPRRVTGTLEFDFARSSASKGPWYSAPVSIGVCETCGHIELYAKLPVQLREWLKGTDDKVQKSRVSSERFLAPASRIRFPRRPALFRRGSNSL